MAKDGNENKKDGPIVCQRDGDGWLARDLDTNDFAYGPTKAAALLELFAVKKQNEHLIPHHAESAAQIKASEILSLKAFLNRFIIEIRFVSNLFWKTAKIKLPEQMDALHDRRKIRRLFHKVFNTPGLIDALALSEAEDSAVLNLLMIFAIVTISSNSISTLAATATALENLAAREAETIGALKVSINNIQAMSETATANDQSSPNPLREQGSTLVGFLEQHEKIQRLVSSIRNSPIGQAGLLATKGGAAKNPDGAGRGAIARALNQCIPPGYNRENGFHRFALIKCLLDISGIESDTKTIRRLVHG